MTIENHEPISNLSSFSFDSDTQLTINDDITPQLTSNINNPYNSIIGETGSANLNQDLKTIEFSGEYENPIVFATSLSRKGVDPAMVRITDISGNDFTAFVEEPNNLAPGTHIKEDFSYVVIEAGTYKLADGTLIEADAIDSNATTKKQWESIEFENEFTAKPVVFSQVQSHKGADFVRTRMKNISADGFTVAMEEEEKIVNSGHAKETIGYLAISEGSGTWGDSLYKSGATENAVTQNNYILQLENFSETPNFMAAVASYDGADPVGVRHHNLTANQVTLKLEEDTSKDQEQTHTTEVVNYLAIEGDGFLTGATIGDVEPEVPEIIITAPNGGETLQPGQELDIIWTDNIEEDVKVTLFKDNSLEQIIDLKTESDGQLSWTVPEDLPPSDRYRIKINQYGDNKIRDFSDDYFSIEPKSEITVTSPNGGDLLEPGENISITWNDNIDENVDINLYRDGVLAQNIAADTPSDGQEDWTIPNNLASGDRYQIKISQFDDNSVKDFSDDYFTIEPEIIPVTHKINDFNGDGKHDILWRNLENGGIHAWKMDGLTWKQGEDIDIEDIPDTATHPVAIGDFNGDGHTDIVTRYYWKDNPGHTQIWLMNNNQTTEKVNLFPTVTDPNWHISGTGDFNKDGDIDLLWRNYKNGENHVWLMDGTEYVESIALRTVKDPNWKIVGTGDFDKDGNIDIVWRNGNANSIWMMDGTERREFINIPSTGDPDWKIVGTGDFNEDGNIDLLLREHNVGNIGVWLMDGTDRIGIEHLPWGVHHPSFHVVGETDPIPTWTAEYFNNKTLSGDPVHVEGVGNSFHANTYNVLSLDWERESPANTPADNFSSRIKTRRYLVPGLYQIQTGSDDGVRFIIDGQKVTDRWVDRGITVDSDSGYFYSTGKEHDIQIEHYDGAGLAALDFKIRRAEKFVENRTASEWSATIYNWDSTQGQPPQDFFAGGYHHNPKTIVSINLGSNIRSDGKFGLSFDWGDGAIDGDSRLPHDNYAIRGYTQKYLEAGTTYKAWVRGDDGFQMFARLQHTEYSVDILENKEQYPNKWEQNYGGAKPYEFTVAQSGNYDFHYHMYEGHTLANFDFALEEVTGGGTGNPNPGYTYKDSDYLYALYRDNIGNQISNIAHGGTPAFDSVDGDSDGKVHALVGGEVIEAKNGRDVNSVLSNWGYNGTVAIYNQQLDKTFIYWHFAENSIDENLQGKTIEAGSLIGKEGDTGYSFGVHTHVEIHNGKSFVDMSNPNFPRSPANSGRLYIPNVFQDAVRQGLTII